MKQRLTLFFVSLFLFVGTALAQTKVTGTVLSQEDGQPIIGAAVKVVGTQTGALTDVNGAFSVSLPEGKKQLEISYLGFESKTVTAKAGMRVFLKTDAKMVDEVIVVAYGTQKKSSFTGSASVVGADEIGKVQVTNAVDALKGKAAGVQIYSSSGQPGTTPTIRIRGKSITEWFIGMPDELYVCLGLAVTVCVLIPADVYLVNSGELWFTLGDLLKYLVPGAAAVFAVLTAVYFILRKKLLRAGFAALVLGLLLGFWLQSYVINLDYGILDGRTIQWGALKKEAALNCIAWVACIILPFIGLKYLQADKFVKLAKKTALFPII